MRSTLSLLTRAIVYKSFVDGLYTAFIGDMECRAGGSGGESLRYRLQKPFTTVPRRTCPQFWR